MLYFDQCSACALTVPPIVPNNSYGDLYESEAHGKLLNTREPLALQYLGCHKPNGDGSILQPRQTVSLNLNTLATQIVLGRSLHNCEDLGDDPTSKYILLFCTHNSFVILKASLYIN